MERFGRLEDKSIGMRFAEVLEAVKEDDGGKFDFHTRLHDIEYDDGGEGKFFIKNQGDFSLTNHAFKQIMNRVGIPPTYAAKTPPALLKPHFDHWLKTEDNKELFIRAKSSSEGNRIRAFLSPQYSVLDNRDILSAFNQHLRPDQYQITNFGVDEDSLNVRLVFPDLAHETPHPTRKNNSFFVGAHLLNGETGNCAVRVDLLLFELWCKNGAIRRINGSSIMMRRHFGRNFNLGEEFETAFHAIRGKAAQTMDSFMRTHETKVADPIATLTKVMDSDRGLFTERMREIVLSSFERWPQPTLYGVISALTQAAQSLPMDRRLDMEAIAGNLMGK